MAQRPLTDAAGAVGAALGVWLMLSLWVGAWELQAGALPMGVPQGEAE